MQNKKYSPRSNIRKSNIFLAAKSICGILKKSGEEAYLVGGSVRDFLLFPKKIPQDMDIATSAPPEKIRQLFPNSKWIGEDFGVCLVMWRGVSVEVATFRVDGESDNKRHPNQVQWGTLEQDSCRRDFTCNALYYDPFTKNIIDLHGGKEDLKRKVLRCVGDPFKRFDEDALRLLRALRFCANFHFQLEEQTKNALVQHEKNLHCISKERIILELRKVKNMPFFVSLFSDLLPLELFLFPNASLTKKESKNHVRRFAASSYPLLNFYMHLSNIIQWSSLEEWNQKVLASLDNWPITREDKKLCEIFFRLNYFEEKNNKMENPYLKEFFLFRVFLRIQKINANIVKEFSSNKISVFKEEKLRILLQKLTRVKIPETNSQKTGLIIEAMKELKRPEVETQTYIELALMKEFYLEQIFSFQHFIQDNHLVIEFYSKMLV